MLNNRIFYFTVFLVILAFFAACQKNHPPVILEMTCSPQERFSGITLTFSVDAFDEDGDSLYYSWSADGGEFLDPINGQVVRWKSPANKAGETFTITVSVSDEESEVSQDYSVTLDEPVFGNLIGNAYFKGCRIPVSGLIVSVGDQSVSTDDKGYFALNHILVGTYTLLAEHPEFHTYTETIEIMQNVTLSKTISMTTGVLACRLFGEVIDQNGDPVSYAKIVMLNPDGSESSLSATTSNTGIYHILSIPHGNRSFTLTRIIGGHTWMAENLAWLPRIHVSNNQSITESRYYVYDFEGDSVSAANSACPRGWHLPSEAECNRICLDIGFDNCGYQLKTMSGWAEHGGGDNSAHFNGMPGGSLKSHNFNGLHYHGSFWTTSQWNSQTMIGLDLSYSNDWFGRVLITKDVALSVRCVKN